MELHGNNYLLANADLAGSYFPECVLLCVCVRAVKSAALQLNAKRVIATETSLRFHLTSVLRSGQATVGRERRNSCQAHVLQLRPLRMRMPARLKIS